MGCCRWMILSRPTNLGARGRTQPWEWGQQALQRLGLYLYGPVPPEIKDPHKVNWWAWLNPHSVYELTFFGSGFPVYSLISQVQIMRYQAPYLPTSPDHQPAAPWLQSHRIRDVR
ncbi:MAG: hypothetical protein KatS3mg051_0805 [Anaerolineae bacterium]|nr:MAG: hypothetical protein KatS3mg051_0805 [Anaerolineae bacterium]